MASFQVEIAPSFALNHRPNADSWIDGNNVDITDLWVHHPQWQTSPNTTNKCSINQDKWRSAGQQIVEVPNSRGVSSLVQKWKGLEAEAKCSCKNEEELFGDWESDRTAASGPPSSRGWESDRTAESERVRVADIIRKLTEDRLCSEIGSVTEPKSPRLRPGRQAYNNLLMRIERDRRRDLEELTNRKAVSEFSHRRRIDSFLRITFLRNGSEPQNSTPVSINHETATDCNDDSETSKGWIDEVSRPLSEWECMRRARYQEMLNPSSENEEIRLLLGRRSVSNFLLSGMREIIDRVMILRSQGQPVAKEEEQGEEEEGDDYGDYFDEYEEQCDDYMADNNITSSPQKQGHEISSDYSDQVSPTSVNFHSQNNASTSSIEMDLICDLRRNMEQLRQEMSDLRKSIKFCIDMQMSIKREVAMALNSSNNHSDTKKKKKKRIENRGKCCVC